jgi:hypothetical protein
MTQVIREAKKVITDLVGDLDQAIIDQEEAIGDWITDFAADTGSAVDIWGSQDLCARIFAETERGSKFNPIFAGDNSGGGSALDQAKKRAAKYLAKGWELFAEEDNWSQAEVLLIKRQRTNVAPS